MKTLKCLRSFAAIVLMSVPAWAQSTGPGATSSNTSAPAAKQWSWYASALGYLLPEGDSYVSPVLTADRQSLHLEARYNYEALETGSLWIGRNFSFGTNATLEVTPMIGGVFGASDGVAPGYLASFGYHRFFADTQGEYLIGTDRSENFFYSWSEIGFSPAEWFRAGIVIQRTKAYQTELDIQRGVFAGVSYKNVDFTTYVFNLGWTDPTTVLGIGFRF